MKPGEPVVFITHDQGGSEKVVTTQLPYESGLIGLSSYKKV